MGTAGRMYGNGNSHEILWRRKLEEQAELQQAIELQGRRLMSLQLLDVKRHHHLHHHRSLSNGSPVPSPTHSPSFFNQTLVLPSDRSSPDSVIENGFHLSNPSMPVTGAVLTEIESKDTTNLKSDKEIERESPPAANGTVIINDNGKDSPTHHVGTELLSESLELNLNLPDSPFASPKAGGDFITAFNSTIDDEKSNSALSSVTSSSANSSLITSTLDMASYNSCYFPVPRFSSGHGAIEM